MAPARIINVKLTPKASSDRIGETRLAADGKDVLSVYVTAAPDKNKANEALLKLLAEHFGVPLSTLAILRGHTSRNKIVSIE